MLNHLCIHIQVYRDHHHFSALDLASINTGIYYLAIRVIASIPGSKEKGAFFFAAWN